MITKKEFLMGRDKEYPLTPEMDKNADELLLRICALEKEPGCPVPFKVGSGYRPGVYNVQAGGSPKSAHLVCQAIDLVDKENKIDNWLTDEILTKYDLYREHPDSTPRWTHLTIKPPKSKKRTFKP